MASAAKSAADRWTTRRSGATIADRLAIGRRGVNHVLNQTHRSRTSWKWLAAGGLIAGVSAGLACGTNGLTGGGGLPSGLDTPPKVIITDPIADVFIENGESTVITYFAQSAEQAASLDIYLDRDS